MLGNCNPTGTSCYQEQFNRHRLALFCSCHYCMTYMWNYVFWPSQGRNIRAAAGFPFLIHTVFTLRPSRCANVNTKQHAAHSFHYVAIFLAHEWHTHGADLIRSSRVWETFWSIFDPMPHCDPLLLEVLPNLRFPKFRLHNACVWEG